MVAATSVGLAAGDSPPLMKKFTDTLINNHMILQADIQSREFSLECPYDKGQEGKDPDDKCIVLWETSKTWFYNIPATTKVIWGQK